MAESPPGDVRHFESTAEDGCVRVGDLRRALEPFGDDVLVVLAKDPEGNGFSPLASGSDAHYQAESTWAGWLVDGELEGGEECVVLWPIN